MTTTFTTTFSSDVLVWVKNRAKKEKKTIRFILEEAVKTYQIQEKQSQLREMFLKANNDPEILAMAEEGLDDSNEQFHKYEQS